MGFKLTAALFCCVLICFASPDQVSSFERSVSAAPRCSKIKPAPSRYVCGTRGQLERGNDVFPFVEEYSFAGTMKFADINACSTICLNRQAPAGQVDLQYRCQTYAYDSNSKLCYFYSRPVNGVFNATSQSTVEYWDVRCFDCAPISCPQAPGVNLIDNGGFEASDKYLGPYSQPYAAMPVSGQIEHPGYKSKNAWKCRGQFCALYQWRLLCFGHHYTLSFDFKVDAGPSSSVYAAIGDAFYAHDFGKNGSSGEWKHVELAFENLFQLELVQISWDQGCTGCDYFIHVDNIKVVPHQGPYATIDGSEIPWTNSGFESGKLAPWQIIRYQGSKGNHSIISPGLRGSKYAFYYNGKDTLTYDHIRLQHQLQTLVAEARYVLKFDYKIYGMVYLDPFIGGCQWVQDGNTYLGYDNYTFTLPQNKTGTFERLFTVSNPTDNVFIIDILKEDYSNGTHPEVVYLDNFSIARAAY